MRNEKPTIVYLEHMPFVSEIFQILIDVKPELSSKYNVRSFGLFGSAARNDFSSSSDIDIIVHFSEPIGIEFIDLANYLEDTLRQKLDLVSKNGIKPAYLQAIEKEILCV